MSKRENRRHHLHRMKMKARKVAKYSWGYTLSNHYNQEYLEKLLKRFEKFANHLKMCSCNGCRNPRRSGYYKNEAIKQEWNSYLRYLEDMGREDLVKFCRYCKVKHDIAYRADQNDSL